MKKFITPKLTFAPAAKTIDFAGIAGFNIKNLISVINQTRGVVIYSTASATLKYTNLTGTVLTLNYDTTAQNANDVLQVIYEDNSFDTPNSIIASNDAKKLGDVVWDYVTDFTERGFDGVQTFNQFSETIKYYAPNLSFVSNRAKCLDLSTPNNYLGVNMVRISPGTPIIPEDATGLVLGVEFSFKGLQNQTPYDIRFGMDTQVGDNRGWAMVAYRNCFDGVSFNVATDQQFYFNTSDNDTFDFEGTGIRQIIPPNEPNKPTIVKAFLKLKIMGDGVDRKAYYDKFYCNGKEYDISGFTLAGESIYDLYTNGCNILFQAANRPTNTFNTNPQGNHFRAFFHQIAFGYVYN
jgi:hypothetical protein